MPIHLSAGIDDLDAPDRTAGHGSNGRLDRLLANSSLGVIEWDQDRAVRRWSGAAEGILGWPADAVLGRPLDTLDLVHPEDRRRDALVLQALIEGDADHEVVEQRNLTRARQVRRCRWYHSICRAPAGDDFTVLSLVEDATELRAAEALARELAAHDPLTGLPNRDLLLDRLVQALAQCRRRQRQGALLLLDLDNFKRVNDSLGHAIGDRLLVEVAKRLLASVRESDSVARLGGDEFALVLADLDTPAAADLVAAKINRALAGPISLADETLDGGVSVGIALFPDDAAEPEDLLHKADLALYRAKAEGRGTRAFYTPHLEQRARARRSLIQELRRAVDAQAFELRYRPRIDLASDRVTALTATLRWRHPRHGLLAPERFGAAAEASGLVRALGRLTRELAFTQATDWGRAGLSPLRIALDLSPIEAADPALAGEVGGLLAGLGLPAGQLEFQITAPALGERGAACLPAGLDGLARLGSTLLLDPEGADLGTLAQLVGRPISRLGIAAELVEASLVDRAPRLVLEALIRLAHDLGLEVVAKGIERPGQRDLIQELGCDQAEGLLFGTPLDGPGVGELVAHHNRN